MLLWLKKHSKRLNFFGGIFILLLTVVLYFWTTSTSLAVATETAQSESKKPFQRTYHNPNMIQRKVDKVKDMSVYTTKLKESKQAENLLLFMMFLGFAMVGYSLYGKLKERFFKA